MNSFRIRHGQTVILQTSGFTACRGSPIVIDSSAYPYLWSILEEIEVVATAEHVPEKGESDDWLSWMRNNSIWFLDEKPNEDTETVKPQPPTPTPVAGSSRDGLVGQIQDVRPIRSPINWSEGELPKEDEVPATAAESLPKSDPLFQWDDDIQQDDKLEEPVKRASLTPLPEQKFKAAPNSSTKTGPGERHSFSHSRFLYWCLVDTAPLIKKEKQRGTDTSASARLGTMSEPPNMSQSIKQPLKFHSSNENPMKTPARPAIDDDTRFDVVIMGPDEDNPTQFKLRGKNSVRKVLNAACRNFDLDPNRFLSLSFCSSELVADWSSIV